ncbi:hypothetical protein [Lysobacter gummosus]
MTIRKATTSKIFSDSFIAASSGARSGRADAMRGLSQFARACGGHAP